MFLVPNPSKHSVYLSLPPLCKNVQEKQIDREREKESVGGTRRHDEGRERGWVARGHRQGEDDAVGMRSNIKAGCKPSPSQIDVNLSLCWSLVFNLSLSIPTSLSVLLFLAHPSFSHCHSVSSGPELSPSLSLSLHPTSDLFLFISTVFFGSLPCPLSLPLPRLSKRECKI